MTDVDTTATIQSSFSAMCGVRAYFIHSFTSITKELKLCSLEHAQRSYLILLFLLFRSDIAWPWVEGETERKQADGQIFFFSFADLTIIHPHNRQGSAIVCSIAHTEEPLERPCAIDSSFSNKNNTTGHIVSSPSLSSHRRRWLFNIERRNQTWWWVY